MYDWAKQSEAMMQNWAGSQMKLLDGYISNMKTTPTYPGMELYTKTLEMWEESVKHMMSAESSWMDGWIKEIKDEAHDYAEKDMDTWVSDLQDASNQWSDMQKEMWESWFDLMKHFEFGEFGDKLTDDGQSTFTSWQEGMEKLMQGQQEWMTKFNPTAKSDK